MRPRPLAARLPLGLAGRLPRAPRSTPTASSTSRSARRSTRRPAIVSRLRWRCGSDAPGYPTTVGTPALREAIVAWFARRRGVPGASTRRRCCPTIGTKELVAWLPTLLGLGPGDLVGIPPSPTRPTTSARAAARATPVVVDGLTPASVPTRRVHEIPALVWLNSPATPTGAVLGRRTTCAKVVEWARAHGARRRQRRVLRRAGLASADAPQAGATRDSASSIRRSAEAPRGSARGVLAVQAVQPRRLPLPPSSPATRPSSPRSLEVRKHAGMMVPGPVQAALTVALGDDAHVATAARALPPRVAKMLLPAPRSPPGSGWTTPRPGCTSGRPDGEDCWETVDDPVARRAGILVAPGSFYGPPGAEHVRMALTATDERDRGAAERLVIGVHIARPARPLGNVPADGMHHIRRKGR